MEKDSFESQLKLLINNADQNLHLEKDGRDKVWNKVSRARSNKRMAYYLSTAAVACICIVSLFWANEKVKPVKVTVTKEIKSKTDTVRPNGAFLANKKQIDKIVIKTLPQSPKYLFEKPIIVDTPVSVVEKTELIVTAVKEAGLVTVTSAPKVEIKVADKDPQQEFTVQFKRGKPTETLPQQTRESLAIKKLKFGRDTSVFTSSNQKPNQQLKIKF